MGTPGITCVFFSDRVRVQGVLSSADSLSRTAPCSAHALTPPLQAMVHSIAAGRAPKSRRFATDRRKRRCGLQSAVPKAMLFSQAAGKGTVVPVTNWARPAPFFSRPALCELPLLNAAGQSRVTLSLRYEHFFKRVVCGPRLEGKGGLTPAAPTQ